MKIRLSKRTFKRVALYALFFYILYYPNFFGQISPLFNQYCIYLVMLACLFVFLPKSRRLFAQMIRNRYVLAYIAGIFVSSAYVAFRALLSGVSIFDIKSMRLIQSNFPIVYLLIILMIVSVMYRWRFTFEDGLDVLIKIAAFQGIICLLMLLSPELKSFANSLYLKDATQFNQNSYILTWRIFGICSDYTYGTPIVNGAICGICFYYALSKDRKYFFHSFLIFMAAILNSRTGVLVAIITVCMAMLYLMLQRGILRKSMVILLILPSVIVLLVFLVAIFSRGTILQQTAMFKEIYAFLFKGETQGTVGLLLGPHWHFPKGWEAIFGTGHRVYGSTEAQGITTSDIGFVNDMFMGGIVYLLMRYSTVFSFTINTAKKIKMPFIGAALCVTWLIANFKGQVTVNLAFTVFCSYMIAIQLFLPQRKSAIKNAEQKETLWK